MINYKTQLLLAFLLTLLSVSTRSQTVDEPVEVPIVEPAGERTIKWRRVIRYEHQSLPEWGYSEPQRDYFLVLPPLNPPKKAPLHVILHGGAKSAETAMQAGLAHPVEEVHFYGDERFCVLYLDVYEHKPIDGGWGWHIAKRSGDTYKEQLTPIENRVFSTIEWVVQKYNIDRNRIYLSGVSMGGYGGLGLGIVRGDIFAAINVAVPGGPDWPFHRLKNTTYPDPPPVLNFSTHVDKYSKGQEDLQAYCADNKLLQIFSWGVFKHSPRVSNTSSPANEFPWKEIVKNEAYPVFVGATTDQTYPGHGNIKAKDQEGQINGYFRWKNLEDSVDRFKMELRLVKKNELQKTRKDHPAVSTAEVSLRRLQRFKVNEALEYKWSMVRDNDILQKGVVRLDKLGLITIKGLTIEANPAVLVIKPVK